jgi:hypothetical protein
MEMERRKNDVVLMFGAKERENAKKISNLEKEGV